VVVSSAPVGSSTNSTCDATAASATALRLSYASIEKHITNIFTKLGLPPSDTDHRRVLAVLRYLNPDQ
jgi:hypothetical protein